MKKNYLFLTLVTCLVLPGTLYAGICSLYTPAKGDNPCDDMNQDNCVTEASTEYYMSESGMCWGRKTCNKCQAGYTAITENLEDCTNVKYTHCECICDNCNDDTTWSNAGTGYQKKILRHCVCDSGTPTCAIYETKYRCTAGYYGSSTNGTSGCTKCPAKEICDGVTSAASSAVGSTAITQCYIKKNSFLCDDSGDFEFTEDCYYK